MLNTLTKISSSFSDTRKVFTIKITLKIPEDDMDDARAILLEHLLENRKLIEKVKLRESRKWEE